MTPHLPAIPDPPTLTCSDGASVVAAAFPDRTWFCARADGTKHGPFFTLLPTGEIEIAGSYQDNKLDGSWKRHYAGGALAEEGAYVAGLADGAWRQLSPTGALLGEYKLNAGTGKRMVWLAYGPLYSETSLSKGVPHGPMRIYDRDGKVIVSAKYVRGVLDGKHTVGTKTSLRIESTFARGKLRGPRKIWQFNALLVDESYDNRGRLDGDFTMWRDRKTRRVQGMYEHGKRVGAWIWTDKYRKKEREGDFVAGKKSGLWSEWVADKLTFQGLYTDGKPDGEFVYYDPRTSSELGRFTINAGTGTLVTFHANKKPATKTHIVNGLMDGKYEELTPLGKTIVEGRYSSDRKHGVWREQTATGVPVLVQNWKRGKLDGKVQKYVDGKLAVESTFKDGKSEGTYTEYRDGKPALTGQFVADRRTGTWTSYDASGTAVITATYREGMLDGPWRQVDAGVVITGTMTNGRRTGTWSLTDRAGKTSTVSYKTP